MYPAQGTPLLGRDGGVTFSCGKVTKRRLRGRACNQALPLRVSKKAAKCAAFFGILKWGDKMLEQMKTSVTR